MAVWLDNWRNLQSSLLSASAIAPIVLFLFCWSSAFAIEPTEEGDTPTAKALLQKVYDDEAWLGEVDSFLLRSERVQTWTDEGMKPRERPALFGGGVSTPSSRELTITSLLAWDPTHAVTEYGIGDSSQIICTWDGDLAVAASHRTDRDKATERVTYVLDDKTDEMFLTAFSMKLLWGHAARHGGPKPWWRALDRGEYEEIVVPRMVELIGREKFGEFDCYRVDVLYSNRFYIRVSDRRLIADVHVLPRLSSDEGLKLQSEIAGEEIASASEWQAWLETLEEEERFRAMRRYWKERHKDGLVQHEELFDDYREVAPNCWFPYEQRTRTYHTDAGKSILSVHSETKILKLEVNTEIPSELFEQELLEGAKVTTDYRYDPWIRYVYHASQTEEDRQKMAEDKRIYLEESERDWEDVKSSIDLQLGQKPPPLPKMGWIGSDPITWDGLKDRGVALLFWDLEYGPSLQALDRLQQLSDQKLAIIAVHRSTEDPKKVEEYVADQGWSFPVVIDTNGKGDPQASLFEWFQIEHVPWMVVIDGDGEFIAHDYPGRGSNIISKFAWLYYSSDNDAK